MSNLNFCFVNYCIEVIRISNSNYYYALVFYSFSSSFHFGIVYFACNEKQKNICRVGFHHNEKSKNICRVGFHRNEKYLCRSFSRKICSGYNLKFRVLPSQHLTNKSFALLHMFATSISPTNQSQCSLPMHARVSIIFSLIPPVRFSGDR